MAPVPNPTGDMPVAFVDRVRVHFDNLLQDSAYQPRLRAFPFELSQ